MTAAGQDGVSAHLSTAREGYDQAIRTLLGVARRTGSDYAKWAAHYLTVDPDRLAPCWTCTCNYLNWGLVCTHCGEPYEVPTDAKESDMTATTPESRARIAYTAYGKVTDFRNFQGNPMPAFDELPERIREAWTAAAGVIWDLATTGKATIR